MVGFWSIDAGQVAIIVTLLGAFIGVIRRLDHYGIEHEMMMDWYCRSHDMEKKDLPTRQRNGILTIFRGS